MQALVAFEQPVVRYRHEMVMTVLEGDMSYSYSTIHKINQWFDNTLLAPTIKVKLLDNLDF